MGLFGVLLERIVIRPILGQPAFTDRDADHRHRLRARGLITMIPNIGTETHTLPVPYKDQIWKLGALVLNVEQMVVIAARPFCAPGCLRCSATASSAWRCRPRRRTSSPPITWASRSRRINGLVWGLAAAVAAIAGLLLAPITFVHANMGFIGLKAFPAAVVGGFTSLPGAIVGGLIIGIVESLSGFYLPAGFKDTAPYVVVLIMLMVKPNGLFGEKLRKKV
jgi:branched-chain amino acid transport system permease protein